MTERNVRLLATVRKNAREEIRITRGDFKGFDIVGLRVWFEDRESGEMRPGKDGLAFRAELVDEIIEGLRAAKAEVGK
jgi:Transcriptional Coactivator p15 (PC4)